MCALKCSASFGYPHTTPKFHPAIAGICKSFVNWNTYLTTVLNNADRASLWNVMITLVGGRFSLSHFVLRHLK